MGFSNEVQNRIGAGLKKDADGDVHFGMINYIHNKIHEGKMLVATHVFEAVADDATIYFRQSVGSLKYLHSQLEFSSTGLWNFKSYIGTTYSGDGTELTQVNRKSDSAYTPDGKVYHTPTIDVLGTKRLDFDFGSGTNPAKSTTAVGSERIESEFAPDVEILVALKNLSGSTQRMSIAANYYEEE